MSQVPKNQEELHRIRLQAKREFMSRYPGIVGVALGFKIRGGQSTEQIAFQVYVRQKKHPSQLLPREMIPDHYQHIPTDVLTVSGTIPSADATPCADRSQHSTLVGGISISTMKLKPPGLYDIGTLGFFVTFPGVKPPYNIGLVTNNHVITDSGGQEGDSIYQPNWETQADGSLAPVEKKSLLVGTVRKLAPKAVDAHGDYVDAALVQLRICISSWCHTNCGVSFGNEIVGLNLNNSNAITDVTNAVSVGDTVYKVGRTTGRTVGRVEAVDAPLIGGGAVIKISAVSMPGTGNCGGALVFESPGDSGAALIDSQGRLIGLIIGHDDAAPNMTHACHIQAVLDALGNVVPITKANPVHDNPAAVGMRGDMPTVIDSRPNQTAALQAKLLDCEEGRRIWDLVEQHRLEVGDLVNHNRRVTVAWRRNQGPAFLNRAMNHVRDPEQRMPREIDGVTRALLLQKMARALADHGSAELREAVQRYEATVLDYAESFDNLHDLVGELAAKELEKEPG